MSEKVLGFKEKDATQPVVSDGQGGIYLEKPTYEIKKDKFVPVVSLQWLREQLTEIASRSCPTPESAYAQARALNLLSEIIDKAEKEATRRVKRRNG